MKTALKIALAGGLALAGSISAASAGTVDEIKKRGMLACGVSQGLPGFSNPDKAGKWSGLDVDLCRAIAAAVLGDANKVTYKPLSSKERFTALQSGEVDLLSRNTTWTLSRDTALGLDFRAVNYYDGQGFMVPKKLGIKSALQLSGAAVCTNTGTTTELNVADYFRANKMEYKIVAFEKADEVIAAYDAGRCDVYTTDRSGVAAQRLKLAKPGDHIVLPEIISKEPLGPAVRHGDANWGDVVSWAHYAMLTGEEMGITSANVDAKKSATDPAVKRLLGTEGDMGAKLGLPKDWAYQIIKQVGNYAESYERNVGEKTPLKLARGKNALWTNGGLQYAPPIR